MRLEAIIKVCHVRSAIRRKSKPDKKYWKNHPIPMRQRIPQKDVSADDWEEYDPRDFDSISLDA